LISWFDGHFARNKLHQLQYNALELPFLPHFLLSSLYSYTKCFKLLSCTGEAFKKKKKSNLNEKFFRVLEVISSVKNLSISGTSSICLANQRMLPVLVGTRDPEMCSISSSKLQRWRIADVNHVIHVLYRMFFTCYQDSKFNIICIAVRKFWFSSKFTKP